MNEFARRHFNELSHDVKIDLVGDCGKYILSVDSINYIITVYNLSGHIVYVFYAKHFDTIEYIVMPGYEGLNVACSVINIDDIWKR
jgi:hypothetical protein